MASCGNCNNLQIDGTCIAEKFGILTSLMCPYYEPKKVGKKKKVCANCGAEIEGNYFKVLDNFLQIKYFDSEENNCFCSQECVCNSLMIEEIDEESEEI